MTARVQRTIASILVLTGAGLVVAGLESTTSAVDCNQGSSISPANCIPAHAVPDPDDFVSGGTSGCAYGSMGCNASGDGCNSSQHWANAREGKCEAYLGGSQVTSCIEDYYVTVVTVYRMTGSCSISAGQCGCKYTAVQPEQTENIQICNCATFAG
jgi:hypothetical protein